MSEIKLQDYDKINLKLETEADYCNAFEAKSIMEDGYIKTELHDLIVDKQEAE